MEREHLKSRLGFILISAGCAIGIGNVWKFPYMVGENGGGAFVLIYLFFLLSLGVPVMTMEFAVGRAAQKSPAKMYQQLEKEGQKWHWHGYASLTGNILLMSFYTVVSGWMLQYFVKMLCGEFVKKSANDIKNIFSSMQSDSLTSIAFMALTVLIGFGVCSLSIQKGVESVTKIMMLALLFIMCALAINGFFMDGAKEGLAFYLLPNLDNIKEAGLINIIVAAMNQAFFTLSLGIGAMATFGSYLGKDRSLLGESITVAILDTFVALTSGLIIFPAVFSAGIEPTSGPPLIFETLPTIFANMGIGRVLGALFFLFMSFAALSTVITVFEGINISVMELTGWGRKKTSIINFILVFVVSLPSAFAHNILADFHPFGGTSNFQDIPSELVDKVFLPLGSLAFILFCTRRYGWGWDNFVLEVNSGKGLKIQKWMKPYFKYVLPLIVTALFLVGIYSFITNL